MPLLVLHLIITCPSALLCLYGMCVCVREEVAEGHKCMCMSGPSLWKLHVTWCVTDCRLLPLYLCLYVLCVCVVQVLEDTIEDYKQRHSDDNTDPDEMILSAGDYLLRVLEPVQQQHTMRNYMIMAAAGVGSVVTAGLLLRRLWSRDSSSSTSSSTSSKGGSSLRGFSSHTTGGGSSRGAAAGALTANSRTVV